MDTDTISSNTERPSPYKKPILIGLAIVVTLAIGLLAWKSIAYAIAKPEKADFVHVDNQRKMLDTSVDAYAHLLADYTRSYTDAFIEERSDEHKTALREQAEERFQRETEIGRERLQRMSKSVAMKDDSVKQSFDGFKAQYEAVFSYYETKLSGVTRIAGAIAGPCAQTTKLNVGKSTLATDYVKVADKCIAALEDARSGSDERTAELLSGVDKMVREQRTKFQEVTAAAGIERSAATMQALALMLQTNSKVAELQSAFEQGMTQDYEQLANKANASNGDLEKVLKKQITAGVVTPEMARR